MAQGDFRLARKTLPRAPPPPPARATRSPACAFALAQLQRAVAQRIAGAGAGSGERAALDAADQAVVSLEAKEGGEKCAAVKLHHRVLRAFAARRRSVGAPPATRGDQGAAGADGARRRRGRNAR